MTTLNAPYPALGEENYISGSWRLRDWLTTLDHKRIGILYMVTLTFLFFMGAVAAGIMRLELVTPANDLVRAEIYDRLFTAHGTIMVWFFLIPSIPTTLGNFLLPLMIGAKDLAFPRLNLASWYIFVVAAILAIGSVLTMGVDTGWTFYTPYSTTYGNPGVVPMMVGIFIAGFASIFTGLNFIVTTHTMRAPGMTWFRLPLFVWSIYATSIILVLATPVLAITLALTATERIWGVGIFDPKLGGDPILFQHLFWFYSHPAVYIMILPGMGVVSELITCFARKRVFGYKIMAYSILTIAVLSFLVWGHHMFVSGQSIYAGMVFSLLSFLIAVPSGVKVFNWTATLHKGTIYLKTPMIYALSFIGLFVMGGLTGLMLATLPIDVHVTDTYFIVAHFHFIMVGGMVSAYLGGLHFWWPKITGRTYPEGWGVVAALLLFLGFILTFFPQYFLGYMGMPRRYASYAPEFQTLNVLSTAGATVLGVGYFLPLIYLLRSLSKPPDAGPNPWNATGLEWAVSSPPPEHNFKEIPVVDEDPYAYETKGTDMNVGVLNETDPSPAYRRAEEGG